MYICIYMCVAKYQESVVGRTFGNQNLERQKDSRNTDMIPGKA